MLDINKAITDPPAYRYDPEGHLSGLEAWTMRRGVELAADEGLTLTLGHWRVIRALRDYYREHGWPASAREVSDVLAQAFAAHGGRAHLYRLFPGGPVTQGSRIAGLPAPPHCTDPHFGSVY